MNTVELMAMLLYFALVIGVGVYFFFKDRKQEGEKEYFLGGRNMGGWVAALSAGASDMSAWVLMGLPGSIYLYGVGKVWIAAVRRLISARISASTPVIRSAGAIAPLCSGHDAIQLCGMMCSMERPSCRLPLMLNRSRAANSSSSKISRSRF